MLHRVIWLDADTDLCTKRLTHRRYDPVSGRPVNLLAIPKDLAKTDLSGWVARAEDDETVVQERLARHATARAELEKVFGCRKTDASTGVFYAVKADGLGERDAKKEQPSLDRTLELVEGSLMRPIPIDIRAQY
ncbi:hypothetical protein BC831DRAFT_517634 [Entophlyctis helioformis]|nr:hypothetical protein BC831DRAFT_517634 [Entophlyctis helioformis]